MSEPKLTIGTSWQFGSPVVAVAFDRKGVGAFACGDGTLRLLVGDQEPQVHQVHDGAILSLDIHPTEGFLTGGDDGRLVCSGAGGASIELFSQKGKWIESISASEASGLIACTAGKDAVLIDGGKQTRFTHETTATGVAFDPKGRRLAVSHYNGVSLWWARSASQATTVLNWKGSHLGVVWSPDGRFVISTMQETALHGWRVEDAADMKMSGYPTRIKSFVWDHRGKMLMTSGASMIVGWPFTGRSGPMGKEPFEIGPDRDSNVRVVATHPKVDVVAAGASDGTVWSEWIGEDGANILATGLSKISCMAFSPDGDELAIGTEDGYAALIDIM